MLQDIVDPIADEKLALFVANSHMRSHPKGTEVDTTVSNLESVLGQSEESKGLNENNSTTTTDVTAVEPIDQEMLKKYICYSRSQVKPILHDIDFQKVILHLIFVSTLLSTNPFAFLDFISVC